MSKQRTAAEESAATQMRHDAQAKWTGVEWIYGAEAAKFRRAKRMEKAMNENEQCDCKPECSCQTEQFSFLGKVHYWLDLNCPVHGEKKDQDGKQRTVPDVAGTQDCT